jgi:type I restriction enzyme R subunit
MSALLDEIIRLRKERAVEYEDYLRRIADIAMKVQAGRADDAPRQLDTPGRLAIYNSLLAKPAGPLIAAEPQPGAEPAVDLALQVDRAVKTRRQHGWRGQPQREQLVKQAIFDVLRDIDAVERIYAIVYAQKEY